jgi:hypothetical protein
MERSLLLARAYKVGALLGTLMLPLAAGAETLMMPDRNALTGTAVTVWGVTTEPNGTPYTLDCGNGTSFNGTVGAAAGAGRTHQRSYISALCTYATSATFTATLATTDASPESDTAAVSAFVAADLTAENLRNVRVNNAIQDGLRNVWVNQQNREANFPAGRTTNWNGSWQSAEASLVALAFQNQGYGLPADGTAPTGVYAKYVVQRALNFVIASQTTIQLGLTPQGDNPCVGVPVDGGECVGLYDRRQDDFHQSYTTGTASLALAGVGSSLGLRTVAAADVPGNFSANYVVGKTYKEILQRMSNALTWGQIDDSCGNFSTGGWYYNFNSCSSDGSTIGWVLLGLLDTEAAGLVVPQWVKDEFGDVFPNLNNDGSIDYQSDGNPASPSSPGPAKVGVGLQGLYFINELAGPRVDAVRNNINSWWSGAGGTGFDGWGCGNTASGNKGCAYAMYNNFKGLRLHGIGTLPNVGRPAGPGAIPANDWYADYVDWFVANQTATGSWSPVMGFSCCEFGAEMKDAIALLILSPVALVLPDPIQFSQIGLSHASGSIEPETNPTGTDHTVVATARAANGAGIPGTQIDIRIISGPNSGEQTSGISDGQGRVSFTWNGNSGAGTDRIQASIGGNLFSNVVEKIWQAPTLTCDVDSSGDVDLLDINIIRAGIGQVPAAGDLRDANTDGRITINDVRYCTLRCTHASCAVN